MSSTINIVGTGGVIEGNFETANINVNLDAIYGVFNATTSSTLSNDNDFDDIWDTNGGCVAAWIFPKSDGENNYARIFDKNRWSLNFNGESGTNAKIEFSHTFDGDNGLWISNGFVIPYDAWTHVAVFYDSDATGNDPVIYLNGVATAITESTTPTGTRDSDASDTLYIGNRADGARTFDGYIIDVKVYKNVAVSATNVAKMASKINVDKDAPDMPTSGLQGWFKFNASTTADSSGNSNNLTASNMGSVVYDAFSVDVYDNSTTTDGTFTVTQGKVEGKALTSVTFDGNGDDIDIGAVERTADTTIAMWINADDMQQNRLIGDDGGASHDYIRFKDNNNTKLRVSINNSNLDVTGLSGMPTGTWFHLIVSHDYSNGDIKVWIDGVNEFTGTGIGSNQAWTLNRIGGDTTDYHDGELRDVRIYDYLLSNEQAASLYSGSYNVTPLHWWKLDEGTGTTSEDYGTGTDADVSAFNGDAAWVNGPLDLDGALTIAANGTLSAPRGNLDLSANLDVTGTFDHNSGKVRAMDGQTIQIQGGNSTPLTFFNLESNLGWCSLRGTGGITVLNTLSATTRYNIIRPLDGNVPLTLGTDSDAGGLTGNAIQFTSNGTNYAEIKAASSLKPWTAATAPDFDSGGSGSKVRIADCDMDPDITTGGGGVTITLTGDCEFDAVTVSDGDTLDFNGQRAVIGGLTSTGTGTITATNSLVYLNAKSGGFGYRIHDNGTFTHGGSTFVVDSSGDPACQMQPTGNTFNNIVFLQDANLNGGELKAAGFAKFCANDMATANNNITAADVTIPTGGTLTAGSSTITASGDFTTSGGLLGASCLTLNGTSEKVTIPAHASLDFSTAFTLEGWIKLDGARVGDRNIVTKVGGYWWLAITDNVPKARFYDGANKDVVATTNVADSKWHHIACTYDKTTFKIYVDGKLEGTNAQTADVADSAAAAVAIGSDGSGTFLNGQIDEVRVWSVARTEALIRADMFQGGTLSNSTGLQGRWKCDEGTGTTVANSGGSAGTAIDGVLNDATAWAGAGTFTFGTSTLVMAKSGTQTITMPHAADVYNLTINDGSTTQINTLGTTAGLLDIANNLTVNEKLKPHASTADAYIRFTSAGKTLTVGSDVRTTALAELAAIYFDYSGSMNIPESTHKKLIGETNSNATMVATGDLTITTELEVNNTTTFNANGNTIQTQDIDVNGGTLDLRNSTVNLTREANFGINLDNDAASINLLTGNTTINGNANPSAFWVPAVGNFEIVGDVSNMIVRTDGDLTVIGSVTNCSTEDSTAGFRQWHHTLDTQQLLDADEAGDDDLRLTKPALDNAMELMTK